MIGNQKGEAETSNIETGCVIACPIPATRGTDQPRTPICCLFTMFSCRGAIGVGGFATVGARVRGAARLDLACPDPKEMALVLEHPPPLPPHGRAVPPVP